MSSFWKKKKTTYGVNQNDFKLFAGISEEAGKSFTQQDMLIESY